MNDAKWTTIQWGLCVLAVFGLLGAGLRGCEIDKDRFVKCLEVTKNALECQRATR